ncbi:hypothetical protein RDV84_20920 [Lysobacter yananisis]|uniref:Uncharacterized protein n=1 Tax=Lysobacter yananisis TaxID=1003114 RepID=A0ABY9P5U9_9GAMM|nr:hypothetical protein [Lysobacter yananisis]WMT02402.1 hypothetical protein RDV84_20920 [Lysobacter yananisis]
MMISIATVSARAARPARGSPARRASSRPRRRAESTDHAKSPLFSGFLPYASNAQCDVKHSTWRTKISDSLQTRNHSRFLNPIGKRLTGAQYFAIQEWHDAVRRECTRKTHIPGQQTRKFLSASASDRRRQARSAG